MLCFSAINLEWFKILQNFFNAIFHANLPVPVLEYLELLQLYPPLHYLLSSNPQPHWLQQFLQASTDRTGSLQLLLQGSLYGLQEQGRQCTETPSRPGNIPY